MSENQKIIEIEVLRYNPESDQEPHLEVYKVPFSDDMSVLQGAQYIKDTFDGSLTCLLYTSGDTARIPCRAKRRHGDRPGPSRRQ